MTSHEDYSKLPHDWALAISGGGYDLAPLYAAVESIYQNAGTNRVSPKKRADVFRAFHLTPLDAARIVILGEDPYPDPDQGHGLAFSTSARYRGTRPRSLGRIFGGLRSDLGIVPTQDDLTPWAERGILLLNVALTHRSGFLAPDLSTWQAFTLEVLRVLDKQPRNVAWLLWGDFANDLADLVPLGNQRHRAFRNAHPRAGHAKRPTLKKSPPFSSASKYLGSDAQSDWTL